MQSPTLRPEHGMHHIDSPDDGVIDFDRYRRYLDSIRERVPNHVYAFASDPRHFDLNSPSSLHDAWLESLIVREIPKDAKKNHRSVEVDLVLLGPMHDRKIRLRYFGVSAYRLTMETNGSDDAEGSPSHGDLYTHELRVGTDDMLTHEVLFVGGGSLLIVCKDLRHSEEDI